MAHPTTYTPTSGTASVQVRRFFTGLGTTTATTSSTGDAGAEGDGGWLGAARAGVGLEGGGRRPTRCTGELGADGMDAGGNGQVNAAV